MSRGVYPVEQILVTTTDAAVIAAGSAVSALAVDQLGIFSYQTNLSIDGTDLPVARDFFIAMGRDTTGDAVLDDIDKSAGTKIQRGNVKAYNSRCFTPSREKVIEIALITANCEADYAIRFDITAGEAFFNYGFPTNKQNIYIPNYLLYSMYMP